MVGLSREQKIFLKGYEPMNERFTSDEEIAMIARYLGLEGKNGENLCRVRNEVVEFYHDLEDKYRALTNSFNDLAWRTHDAMMSVTAVIDHYKVKVGRFDLV
jgi:hypothetical protein